jgi:DNA repair protein RadC
MVSALINDERNNPTTSLNGIKNFSDALKSINSEKEGSSMSIVETRLYRRNSKRYSLEYASTPEQAALIGRSLFRSYYDREYVYAVAFSSKMEPLAATLLSVGSLTAALIDPGRLFAFAILASANSIMLFHNHVSGLPNPSKEDENISMRIKECSNLMGIQLSDHIIIGKDTYFSMKKKGLI